MKLTKEIIKALELCSWGETDDGCDICPYREPEWNGSWETDDTTCWAELRADALENLRHYGEALPPVEASEMHKKIGYAHDCPSCHCSLGYKEKKAGLLPRRLRKAVLYEHCQPFCGFCGQRINWNGVK